VNILSKNNYHKASITLAVVTVGFLISFPFRSSFAGGLLESLFGAAMIGGLADWFAVSALFRKPLGIPWRTEIIPKNRDKIFNTLIDMAENELLTRDNIKKRLAGYNISDLLIRYITEYGGNKNIKVILNRIIRDIWVNINPEDTGKYLEDLLKENALKIKLSPLLLEVVEWSLKNGYDEKVIDYFLDELIRICGHRQMKIMILNLYCNFRKLYEQGLLRRKVANEIILSFILRLPPEIIADYLQAELLKFLKEIKEPASFWRDKIKVRIQAILLNLKQDTRIINKLEAWKINQIEQNLHIQNAVVAFIRALREEAAAAQDKTWQLYSWTDGYIDRLIKNFKKDYVKQDRLNEVVKSALNNWIDRQHKQIGIIIKESLNRFSGYLLVEFIENRVGNDLQMIRINGSVVGGLTGVLIFLLTFWMT
jgi:uncharacterized membrane-anchored protein YjiN (DUF445 family)